MGFRSTFTTEDYTIKWPAWFIEKYGKHIWFAREDCGALHSKGEAKTYGLWEPLPEDIQRAVNWESFGLEWFVLVYLHECGGITRCQIGKDSIVWSEPQEWQVTEGVTHDYCYGCSNVSSAAEESRNPTKEK